MPVVQPGLDPPTEVTPQAKSLAVKPPSPAPHTPKHHWRPGPLGSDVVCFEGPTVAPPAGSDACTSVPCCGEHRPQSHSRAGGRAECRWETEKIRVVLYQHSARRARDWASLSTVGLWAASGGGPAATGSLCAWSQGHLGLRAPEPVGGPAMARREGPGAVSGTWQGLSE